MLLLIIYELSNHVVNCTYFLTIQLENAAMQGAKNKFGIIVNFNLFFCNKLSHFLLQETNISDFTDR